MHSASSLTHQPGRPLSLLEASTSLPPARQAGAAHQKDGVGAATSLQPAVTRANPPPPRPSPTHALREHRKAWGKRLEPHSSLEGSRPWVPKFLMTQTEMAQSPCVTCQSMRTISNLCFLSQEDLGPLPGWKASGCSEPPPGLQAQAQVPKTLESFLIS